MKMSFPSLTLSLAATVLLLATGCASKQPFPDKQYWQRSNTSQSVMMRGEKAQQLLHKDMAECATELRELERLHEVEDAVPIMPNGRLEQQDPLALEGSGAALIGNNQDYNNFDGCMYAKGWERTLYLPFKGTEKKQSRHIPDKPSSIWQQLFY